MATIPVTDGQGSRIPDWIWKSLPWLLQFGTIIWFLSSLNSAVKTLSTNVGNLDNEVRVQSRAIVEQGNKIVRLETQVDNLDVRRRP